MNSLRNQFEYGCHIVVFDKAQGRGIYSYVVDDDLWDGRTREIELILLSCNMQECNYDERFNRLIIPTNAERLKRWRRISTKVISFQLHVSAHFDIAIGLQYDYVEFKDISLLSVNGRVECVFSFKHLIIIISLCKVTDQNKSSRPLN